ncbi:MAG: glycosyltransferase family 4 protein [Cyanobacteria bacterium CRU_2_1]|nr:glycosyltransferase family 4 protein [Scytonema sp. RU_4_4]NJR63047.1 glycosyltransferase family 4 protein [Cyanobacteria bacterium CRU_2_1]
MRLAYICADPGVPVFGHKGCSIHVQEMIRALRKQGVQVELFATRLGGEPPPDLETLPIHRLPHLPKGEPNIREKAALAANYDLLAVLEHKGPFDLVYERYSLWSFAGMEYAHARSVPGILEVNAPLIEEQAAYRSLIDRDSAEHVAARVFNSATVLSAVSKEVAAYLERYLISQNHLYVVPNGVNPDRFPPDLKSICPSTSKNFTVGFVGSLKPWHGLPVLVEAFAILHQRVPKSRLLIVGDGTEKADLVADLSARGLLEAAHLTGAVPPNEVPELLASMDVAVAPYPDQSQFYFSPLKVYEYMAAGVPVVASRIGQLEELIQDKVNGILCPPGDAMALAAALGRLRWQSQLRVRLGQAGRATVLKNYTWDAIVQRLLNLCSMNTASEPRCVEAKT